MEYLNELNYKVQTLRGIAIIAVVIIHTIPAGGYN